MGRKRTRNNEDAQSTPNPEVTEGAGQSESASEMPATDTAPEVATEEPAWKARVAARAAEEAAEYELVPGTWFARQHPRIKTATAREITRMGHRVQRMETIGVIRMVESKSEQDA